MIHGSSLNSKLPFWSGDVFFQQQQFSSFSPYIIYFILLTTATERLDYEINCYDRCVLTLPSASNKPGSLTDGFVVIQVDDIAEGRGPRHQERMRQLESMLKFGKVEDLRSQEGTTYAGRYIRQLPGFGFEISMEEFIYTRLEPILSNKKVLKKHAAQTPLNESEKTQLRGLSPHSTGCRGRDDPTRHPLPPFLRQRSRIQQWNMCMLRTRW